MLSKKNRLFILVLIILLIVLINIYYRPRIDQINEAYAPKPQWATPFGSYTVNIASTHFDKLWEIQNLFIYNNDYGRNLLTDGKNIFLVGSSKLESPPFLYRFDLLDGKQEWVSQEEISLPVVMTQKSNNIFVASGVPSVIAAYDVDSGTEIWRRQLSSRMKSTHYMFVNSNDLYISTVPVHLEIINATTGIVKKEDLSEDFFPIFLVDDGTIYHRTLPDRLQATSKLTGDILWEVQFNEEILLIPIFTTEFILVRTGHPSRGQLSVIERTTGNVLWAGPRNIVSNVSVDGEIIFYLTDQSRLIAQNIQTGEKIGEIKFSPELIDMNAHDFSNREFSVVASNGFVLVYFGSSWQLFAFRFLPDS